METLAVNGEFTQIRLSDGTTGWVKSAFLTTQEPATVRLKQLQEELDRSRATTPALAEAAARSELEQLKKRTPRQAGRTGRRRAAPGAAPVAGRTGGAGAGVRRRRGRGRRAAPWPLSGGAAIAHPWLALAALLAALAAGFWLGYAALARRVRQKFGGIKVY